jgi:hypothetical protein
MLQLTMKCWNSAFNAWGWRLFIVVVNLRSVRLYVAAVEALSLPPKLMVFESQFITKIDGFWISVYHQNWWFLNLSLSPKLMVFESQFTTKIDGFWMNLSLSPKLMVFEWILVYHQNWWFSEFHLMLNANVLFCRFKI